MTPNRKKNALGKGLRALLEDIDKDSSEVQKNNKAFSVAEIEETKESKPVDRNGVLSVPIHQLEVNPFQPRADFDEEALQELAESIKVHGVIQPITVRRLENGHYQLIAGERRTRASKIAGLEQIPAYVREANDQEMLEIALIENIQREDLNPLEVAFNYKRLQEECVLTQEQLAKRLGKSRSAITNFLRLLKLAPGAQHALKKGIISMGHGRALLGLETFEEQEQYCRIVIEKELSVRETEKLMKTVKLPGTPFKPKKEISAEWVEIRNIISQLTGSRANIRSKGNDKGEIVIPFNSGDELNLILERLEN